MFPGPYSSIIRNEAGEVIGWDNHYYDEPPEPMDDAEYSLRFGMYDDAYEEGQYAAENDEPYDPEWSQNPKIQAAYKQGYEENNNDNG